MKRGLFLVGMLLSVFSHAQSTDSSGRSKLVTTSPKLGGVTITDMVVPIKANGNTFLMQTPIVDVGLPVYKHFRSKHPVLIKTGIRYEGLLLSNEEKIGGTSFHSITVPLLYSYSFSRATNIAFIGLASVGSDFKQDIEGQDIQYTVGVRVGFQQNKAFKYGVTLAYVSNYSGTYLIPLPDIDWTISKRWNLTGIVPARLSLKYQISAAQSLGVTSSVGGSMYRLNEGPTAQYLHLRQNSAGLIYDLKLGQRWKLNLIAGHTFMQRLETFDMDQKISLDNFGKLNDRVSNVSYQNNAFIFQGGISYVF